VKRYPSFDVIRGAAIMGVLCFHVLNATYDKNAAISAALNAPLQNIPLILLAIFLIYLGSFDKLFILLSALVNTITIDKQWQQRIDSNSNEETQSKAFKSILLNQLTRGGLIVVFGYISENLLNGLVLNVIIQTPDAVHVAFSQLWVSNVIVLIGWGVIVSAVSYLTLLRYHQSLKRMRGILLLCALASLILTPIIISLLKLIPGFWPSPDSNWWTRDFGTNLLFFLLAYIAAGPQPIFPYVCVAFIGVVFALDVKQSPVEKQAITQDFCIGIACFLGGVCLNLLHRAFPAFDVVGLDNFLMASGGAIVLLLLIFYMVEVRGKGPKFAAKTVYFRRFGLLTLTLWCLQWVMVLPIIALDPLFGGRALEGKLNGGELLLVLLVIMIMWSVVLRLWEKVNFKGSFEWLTVKILSRRRKSAGERLELASSLYNIESPLTEVQFYYRKRVVALLWVMFIGFALTYAALIAF